MTTVQIVGIAVAAAVLSLLIVALFVTRHRAPKTGPAAETADGSFLDDRPQDTLAGLGRAEQPMEDVTLDPVASRAAAAAGAGAAIGAGEGLNLDWGRAAHDERRTSPNGASAPRQDEHAGEPPAASAGALHVAPGESRADAVPPGSAPPTAPSSATPPGPAAQHGRMVPLSDVLVTTSNKTVDLDDPEVRRMLTDLVKFEIDQATQFRQMGQTIDAVLQLTEAEKVSRALGMRESAQAIHEMMLEVRSQG